MEENSKRIAKNTVFLYFRFFVTMMVSLYTSRIILQNLGIENYGIYNVISGIVILFSMLNLSLASQRFISFELGKQDFNKIKILVKNFNLLNIFINIIIILVAETIGLWFLKTQMTIPSGRLFASMITYQCTIISFISLIYSSTYVSCVISYERMSVFAAISIIEVLFKLLIAVILPVFVNFDSLILYAVLMMLMQLLSNTSYILYCKYKITGIPLTCGLNRVVLKEILGFSMWMNVSGVFVWLSQQGLNILLNIFVGPIVNAARGISMQVLGAVENFCISFLKAVVPQITKSYSSQHFTTLNKLFILSSKYAFLLIFFVSLPIFFYTDYILALWLGENVPEFTGIFIKLILIWICLSILSQPCMYVVQASGKIKTYQINDMVFCCLIFMGSYIALKFSYPCWSIYIISIVFEFLLLIIRLYIVSKRITLKYREYIRQVIFRLIFVCVPTALIIYIGTVLMGTSIIAIVFSYLFTGIIMAVILYAVGLQYYEKEIINSKIRNIWIKLR